MKKYQISTRLFLFILGFICFLSFGFLNPSTDKEFKTIPLKSGINNVQPMTGIVLWEELDNKDTDAIQLDSRTPFASQPDLLDLKFGIFDDTFHLAWKPSYNLDGWKFFGLERYKESPVGGEITFRQEERSDYVDSNWEKESRNFGITYMICEQWLRWITIDRVREHSMVCGYKFKVKEFKTNETTSQITMENTGVAPIYYDAYVTVNGIRSTETLKYLQPGESREYKVDSGGSTPELSIECDRLVPGQRIEYEADLK